MSPYYIFSCTTINSNHQTTNNKQTPHTAKINQDFESHIIQNEWTKYRSLHLQRFSDREVESAQRDAEIQQKLDAFKSEAAKVHAQLDEMIDVAKGKLVDLEVEVNYDVNRLNEKFKGSLVNEKSPEGQCLDVRAELSLCYNTLKDSGECQIFAQRLDKCVTEALALS